MFDPLPSDPTGLPRPLDLALETGTLTLAQFERLTAVTLAQIQKNAHFVQDQLDAAAHLHDPNNWLAFLQDLFQASQTRSGEVAGALFELSQEFHAELTTLACLQTELPPGAQVAITVMQQAMQASQQSWAQAQQAAKASAALLQADWAQAPRPSRRTRSA